MSASIIRIFLALAVTLGLSAVSGYFSFSAGFNHCKAKQAEAIEEQLQHDDKAIQQLEKTTQEKDAEKDKIIEEIKRVKDQTNCLDTAVPDAIGERLRNLYTTDPGSTTD